MTRTLGAALVLLVTSLAARAGAQGRIVELDLEHGAVIRRDAPEAIAQIPEGVDASGPVALVLMLHGYSGCTRVLASSEEEARCRPRDHAEPGFGWARAHDAAGTRSVLLIPQLAFRERDGTPGRFTIAGEAARFVDEALAALAPLLGGALDHTSVASITIAAHSAAFETTLAIVRHGGLDGRLRHVVLFDALYAGGTTFLDWVGAGTQAGPRTLVSLATGGRTWQQTEALLADARRRWPTRTLAPETWPTTLPPSEARLVIGARAHAPHHDVPVRYLAETLRALGLPSR